MKKRNKIMTFSGIIVAVAIITVYLVFSKQTICKKIEVNIINGSEALIIDKQDIEKIILKKYEKLIGSSIDMVDLVFLETIIEAHPSIKNAEVFKKHDGTLSVKLEQRIPIIRIMPKRNINFYVDEEGYLLPTSEVGSIRVPVANGNIEFDYEKKSISVLNDTVVTNTVKDLYKIAKYISEDKFIKAQIEQIYVTDDGEYELVPKVGKHIVMLGSIDNYEKKFKYLKHFYLNVMNEVGWRTYDYLNLKYKGQIVCTRTKK